MRIDNPTPVDVPTGYSEVSGSRSANGTTYTNSGTKTMDVFIRCHLVNSLTNQDFNAAIGISTANLVIAEHTFPVNTGTVYDTIFFRVPKGWKYYCNAPVGADSWYEST
jgi:hypothetical protein